LVEQPIRKGLSLAYVVVKLGIAEVRFRGFLSTFRAAVRAAVSFVSHSKNIRKTFAYRQGSAINFT
jgi:hypothetical protein